MADRDDLATFDHTATYFKVNPRSGDGCLAAED
jgi:hypothetical protein